MTDEGALDTSPREDEFVTSDGGSALSRRREAGGASARSLLLTILGEFVLPRGDAVWTAALVRALGELGIEEKTARQSLARTAADELISSERDGRRVRWALTPRGHRLLADGAERIYGFTAEMADWDGQWLVLAVSVPESQRQLRHRLRTRLTWAGLGSPLPGLWITPDATKETEALAVVEELGLLDIAVSFVGRYGHVGDERQLVDQAWPLEALQHRYAEFVDQFSALEVSTDEEAFRAQVRLVQEWRRFPFLDPGLPGTILPASWAGADAAALFRRQHVTWHAGAQRRWDRLAGPHGV
jgi:phenylacetic acid degradation operon negative regulatory protein